MFVGFLTWWYGSGLTARVDSLGERLARVSDFFSIGLLARTLFTPFRQLQTGQVRGPFEAQLRAFFDNLLSRFIGAFIRSVMIGLGFGALFGAGVYGLLLIAAWIVLPVVPIVGAGLALMGIGA